MNGRGSKDSAAEGLRAAQVIPSAVALAGAGALDFITPDLRSDPRVALRDMRLREPDRTAVERCARQEGLKLADESCPDAYDPERHRDFTVLRGPNIELVLIQIDDWIANDGSNIGALIEAAYAFKGKRVCVLSVGVDAPAKSLGRLFKDLKSDLQIEGEFVPWRYVVEMERGLHAFASVFDFDLPRPVPPPAPIGENGPQVFISYSHEDDDWLKRLRNMLKPVERQFPTAVWSDKEIEGGSRWLSSIERALTSARVVLLLVSPAFLASDFIHENELGPVLAAVEQGRKKILWMLLSDCLWDLTTIKDYRAAHDVGTPLDRLSPAKQNVELKKVANEVLKLLKQSV
jgi:hypothetical protein